MTYKYLKNISGVYYKELKSCRKVSEKFGIHKETVSRRIKSMNLSLKEVKKKYNEKTT